MHLWTRLYGILFMRAKNINYSHQLCLHYINLNCIVVIINLIPFI